MAILKRLWIGWKRVAEKIAHVQTLILLTLLYVVVILPFGVVASLFGDPLGIKRGSGTSFWRPRGTPPPLLDAARRQF
jgi:hypothetical protein